ncbi:serine/threonine protein kinase [Catenulispora sp. NF23]|uniref:serine/threonine-protein kinase n=1 Tax=Catenulispora pinistramenti TaxID=2705254 RepID=UPI001BAC6858|nr:serine/threonine-protein kinase [Catenulispora pinistramenti]MBS2532577.1 serine/threonine protein kinase [Catenulispora pinistramenti]
MDTPDPQHVTYLASRAKELQIKAQNLVNGSLGRTDDGSRAFILGYMNVREEVERLLREAGTPLSVLNELQSPRHRSLVAGQVANDHVYREVRNEIDIVQQVLEDIVGRLTTVATPAPPQMPDGASFTAESGRQYRYQPAQLLGRGRFSAVYQGIDDAGSAVAVKRLEIRSGHHAHADAQQARRELDIARQLAAVPGSHIMPVLDALQTVSEMLLVMPLAERSLAAAVDQDGPFSPDAAKELLRQITLAIQHMAGRAVLHRDIKPANVLLHDGSWHLADFGVSRILSAATATYTFQGTATLEYLAPEAWHFGPQSVASDLYALGCVGFEILTGRRAFDGPEMTKQLHETYHPQLPEGTDPVLAKVINQLLAKDPDQRPPDARRVIELLAPRDGLTSSQKALQQFTASAAQRQRRNESLNALGVQRHERRARARVALDALWSDLVTHAQEADPDIEGSILHEAAYLMTVGDARLRVNVDDNPPGWESPVLLVAELFASVMGVEKPLLFANLVCMWRGERPVWCLAQFSGPAPDRPLGVASRGLYDVEEEDPRPDPEAGYPSPAAPSDIIELFARAVTSMGIEG